MAAWRRVIELSLGDADLEKLRSIAQSRTEPASHVERARIGAGLLGGPVVFCGAMRRQRAEGTMHAADLLRAGRPPVTAQGTGAARRERFVPQRARSRLSADSVQSL